MRLTVLAMRAMDHPSRHRATMRATLSGGTLWGEVVIRTAQVVPVAYLAASNVAMPKDVRAGRRLC